MPPASSNPPAASQNPPVAARPVGDPAALARQGGEALRAGRYGEATSLFAQSVAIEETFEALFGLASAEMAASGGAELAGPNLDKALVIRPNDALARRLRADVRAAKGDVPGAISDLGMVITGGQVRLRDPYATRGALRFKSNDIEGAASDFSAALQIDPRDRLALEGIGNVELKKSDYGSAIRDLGAAIAVAPSSSAYLARANAYIGARKYDLAYADALKVTASDPNNPNGWLLAATVAHDIGRYEESLRLSESGKGITPSDPLLLLLRGRDMAALGRWPEAMASFGHALAARPDLISANLHRAFVEAHDKAWIPASDDLDVYLRDDPRDAVAYNSRCWIRLVIGRDSDAKQDCDRALEIEPDSAATLDTRAAVHMRMRQYAKALDDTNAALRIEPNTAATKYLRAMAKDGLGDRAGAAKDRREATKLDPNVATLYAPVFGMPAPPRTGPAEHGRRPARP